MRKTFYLPLMILLWLFGCKNNDSDGGNKQTILTGTATILVDETLTPIINDQVAVFESAYQAKINLVGRSETEVVNALLNNSAQIAILTRTLTNDELKVFQQRKITPRTTKFAIDAVAFIRNKQDQDTLIALSDVVSFLKGNPVTGMEGMVFDNLNSSTARYLAQLAGLPNLPEQGVYSFKDNREAIKYISENKGMIGIVGLNWLSQPPSEVADYLNNISVLSVKGLNGSEYHSPTQTNIAQEKYPLARDLVIVDCQGFAGLGKGFSSFIAGERGQRIILKSGLLPVRMPSRKIVTRNQIQKNNN